MPRAVQFTEFGNAEVLRVVDVGEVHPASGRVRVRVKAVGLNPYDFKVRSGSITFADPKFPRGIGGDFAGIVDELGVDEAGTGPTYSDGSLVAVGDEVLGWSMAGTLRDQLLVPATQIARKPPGLSWAVAGSLGTPVQTALSAIETLNIGASDTVLVSAAAGSVGFLYAQLAIARGARVIGTASLTNAKKLESIGAIPTTYGPGLAERVRTLAPEGITAAQDNSGRETIDAALELGLSPDRICTIVDFAAIDELGVVAPSPAPRLATVLERFAHEVADAALVLPVQQVFPLDRVREAFDLLEGRHLSGKVVVTP
ncbi:MAG: NADP-dependent oxidoreductase [Microbacteriaceae bacterium]